MPVTTFVNYADSLQRLQTSFQNLQKLKQQLDPDEVITPNLLEDIQKRLAILIPEKLTKTVFLQLQQQLTALYQYLYQFNTFQQLARTFFQETQLHFAHIKEEVLHFHAFKACAEQLFMDFRKGKFWRTGMDAVIEQLQYHIAQFYETVGQHVNTPVAKSLLITTLKQINWKDWAKEHLLPEVDANSHRFTQIRDWYHHHNDLLLKDLIGQKDNDLAPYLARLRKVLPKGDTITIREALDAFRKVVLPTRLLEPDGTQTLTSQLVDFKGEAEPHSLVRLVVNGSRTLETIVNQQGYFNFPEVRLTFGENKIEYYNHHFHFIDNEKHQLNVYVETNYPFLGRQDPLTQKAFEIHESKEIIRCTTCKNYMYDYSVEEKEGECTLLWCDGKEFHQVSDKEFWQ